jgi:hypothetical protein
VSRVRTLLVALAPPLLAGLVLGSETHAETGRRAMSWSSTDGSVIVAQAEPRGRPRAPTPPGTPAPPAPPAPPSPPGTPAPPSAHVRNRGLSISIRDGKIEIQGIAEVVTAQLDSVLRALDHMPNVEPEARDRVKGRVKAVRNKIKARIHRLKSMDLDKIGPEIERIGDEIEKEMEGVDKDLEQLSEKLSKHFAERVARGPGRPVDHSDDDGDDDDDDDEEDGEDAMSGLDSIEPPELQDRIAALRTLTLNAEQKQKLSRLRIESDQQVEEAKRELERMSSRLRDSLSDSSAREADIVRQIDKISEKEAAIRKVRLLTWIKVRNLLRDDQRKLIETAVRRQ